MAAAARNRKDDDAREGRKTEEVFGGSGRKGDHEIGLVSWYHLEG
jgi:hypothetical protein